jgi:hypothetical protein
LASASRSSQKAKVAAVTTEQYTIYQLANSGRWFKAAPKNQETRKWIEEVVGTGEDVFVVVGYQWLTQQSLESKNFQARLQLPVSEAASAAGAVAMISDPADLALDIHSQRDDSTRRQFVAAGEQIYAVQYRKVRFGWFPSRDLDRAALEKGRWTVHGSLRGQEVETSDVLEAAISKTASPDRGQIRFQGYFDVQAPDRYYCHQR